MLKLESKNVALYHSLWKLTMQSEHKIDGICHTKCSHLLIIMFLLYFLSSLYFYFS